MVLNRLVFSEVQNMDNLDKGRKRSSIFYKL